MHYSLYIHLCVYVHVQHQRINYCSSVTFSGYCFRIISATVANFLVKAASDYYYYITAGNEWVFGQWLHVIFTWKSGQGIRGYLNGCDMDPGGDKGYATSKPRSIDVIGSYPFSVGSGRLEDQKFQGTIDELYIWYERLNPRQIWQLYTQGGKKPWWSDPLDLNTWLQSLAITRPLANWKENFVETGWFDQHYD